MSQQINLYDPALLHRREVLTLANLAGVVAVIALVVTLWGIGERVRAAALEQEVAGLAPEARAMQEQIADLGRRRGDLKSDPRIEAELLSHRARLASGQEVIDRLKQGMSPSSASFAEYLRALGRQVPPGLWLTGFSVGAVETGMEIKGRMLTPGLLPEFIHRLANERAFAGRSFAALQVNAVRIPLAGATTGQTVPPASDAVAPSYHEFTLVPTGATLSRAKP
jgi:hypothetical protein